MEEKHQLEIEKGDQVATVRCSGQFIGGDETEEIRNVLFELMVEYKDVVLDMERVTYVNSSFLSTLLSVQTAISRRGGKMVLAGLNGMLHNVLSTTGMDQIIKIFPTVEEALESLSTEIE